MAVQRHVDKAHLQGAGLHEDLLKAHLDILAGQEAVALGLHHIGQQIGDHGQEAVHIHGRHHAQQRAQSFRNVVKLGMSVKAHFDALNKAVAGFAVQDLVFHRQKRFISGQDIGKVSVANHFLNDALFNQCIHPQHLIFSVVSDTSVYEATVFLTIISPQDRVCQHGHRRFREFFPASAPGQGIY